ncbi:aminotransferase-like domain-containing protein [Acinetobacter larvae]|uniref:GntR family transcriptional regulator n=1 Tax=Acinetobacter larvae TaxID=1789224 RepID=A0A1B2LVG9_9GAMM|nr:PLP-dependent aminotransferase family protein [Acinetobacter larvae]AOA56941.1 GntR family transcriptional regulator [Acinetobacter larvae]
MRFQYQILAQQLAQKIYQGELPAGQRLSSLRQFAKLQQVSLNTAQHCYALLEAQGLIYVRPKAGYFVQPVRNAHPSVAMPVHPDFQTTPRRISNLELQIEIQEDSVDPRLVHLGSIQLSPRLIPSSSLRRSLQRALKHSHSEDFLYSDRQGNRQLQEALAAHWAEDGFYIPVSEIYISNGCMPALAVLIQTLTQIGDSIIVPTPSFNGQLQLLGTLKRKIIEVPAHHQGIDLDRLEQAMRDSNSKLCLLTANFHNPLGFVLSNDEKQKIAALAARYQCFIIEDDIYAECSHTPVRPLPIKYWDQQGYVIYCGSISKVISPSYRVGWFSLPPRLQQYRAQILLHLVVVNTPLQLGLADFIYSRAYREHLTALRPVLMQQVQQYRDYIIQSFADVEVRLSNPSGGYALWLQLPEHIDSMQLYLYAKQQGINIVPGIVFGEEQRYKNCIRLNAGHELNGAIAQAIDCLAAWTQQQL